MAQAATNPKIEELRGRLKADPKSRLFYPLAEELRKLSQLDESEQVLRSGLSSHPAYLSAWVSLGRVLRDRKKNQEAIEALSKALQLDPGNVVAARLLADAYLDLGEKVEAVKKYKLVFALLPSDDELKEIIARIESQIGAPPPTPLGSSGEAAVDRSSPAPESSSPPLPEPAAFPEALSASSGEAESHGRVFDETGSSVLRQQRTMDLATGDAQPMRVAHSQSPFEEPGLSEGYGSDAFAIEQPQGMHLSAAPEEAELPEPVQADPFPSETAPFDHGETAAASEGADVFESSVPTLAPGFVTEGYSVTSSMSPLDEADFARTIRMADLFASEGAIDEARDIYEDLLARDPHNATIRSKIEALEGRAAAPPSDEPDVFGARPPAEESAPAVPAAVEPPLSSEPQSAASGVPELAQASAAAPVEENPVPAAPQMRPAEPKPKVDKLESWLSRVKRV